MALVTISFFGGLSVDVASSSLALSGRRTVYSVVGNVIYLSACMDLFHFNVSLPICITVMSLSSDNTTDPYYIDVAHLFDDL